MGLKETVKAMKARMASEPAFIELTVGPRLIQPLDLDDFTSVHPLTPRGNGDNIKFGIAFVRMLGVPTDDAFEQVATTQGRPFYDITATLYRGLNPAEFSAAQAGTLPALARNRSVIGAYVGGDPQAIVRAYFPGSGKPGQVEFLGPLYRGIPRPAGDNISPELLRKVVTEHANDQQLHYNISVLTQIYGLESKELAIARYFSMLESMAGPLASQLQASGGSKSVTRASIRLMLGYYETLHIPRFSHGGVDYEFDHIEIAGRLRHSIFHGSGHLTRNDITVALEPGLALLQVRPDMVAHALRRDCEREIAAWVDGSSKALRAAAGEPFELPPRDPNYTGEQLPRLLVSSSGDKSSPISSVWAHSPEGSLASVTLLAPDRVR